MERRNPQSLLDCGGGLTLLSKRLVLPRGLKDTWRDGPILVDEQHPSSGLALTITGSYPDIIRGLIDETLQYGPLPITLPAIQGGEYTRTWYAWDLATVADRITDITNLENGSDIRLDPRTDTDGNLTYELVTDPEPTHHQWNTIIPGARAILTTLDGDGTDMTSQVWATGGKDDDKTLMCRRTTIPKTTAACSSKPKTPNTPPSATSKHSKPTRSPTLPTARGPRRRTRSRSARNTT